MRGSIGCALRRQHGAASNGMRLFISIQLNDEMKHALRRIQHAMQSQGVQGNFTREENLHLTLAFIGEYPDPEDVLDVMEQIEFEPFDIRLDGVGSFGSLWWAGIDSVGEDEFDGSEQGNGDALRNLAKHLRRGLADAGIPFDRKKFLPHITLVRKPQMRNDRSTNGHGGRNADGHSGRNLAIPEAVLEDLPMAEMLVEHVSLMRSERGKHGMIYTELGRI